MSKEIFEQLVMNRQGDILAFPEGVSADAALRAKSTEVDVYAEAINALFPVGTFLIRGKDEYAYCKNGTSAMATLGTSIQQAKPVHAEQDDDIVVGAAAAIGALTVELTSSTNLDNSPNNAADDFKGGYLIVNDAAGQGQMYKIKANEAFANSVDSTFTLYEALTVALTTSSEAGLIRNPFYQVLATESPVSGMFIGVNLLALTASYFFWAKVKGPAPVVCQAAIALGTPAVVGVTAAKVDPLPSSYATTHLIIGEMMTPGVADTEQAICYLKGL